uniref:SMC_N domain-containing protein n=1 Tax=Caenorhabditis tropicalis TaxID=1561998 RepID=A0A1I7THT5_9PELO
MYPPEINNTFLGAFGHVLVVDSIECAGEIAYNPAIKVRCLSVRGDDVKPNGVMAGGYMENGKTSILMSLQPWHKNNEEARAADVEIADLAQRLASNGRKSEQYKAMRLSLDKLEHSLIMINNNISNSKLGMIQKDVEEQKAIIESATKEIEESSVELGTVQAKVKELESKRSNDKGSKERMKKELSAKLLEAEKRAASHKDKAEKARRAVLQLQASVDELAQNIANDEAELEKKKKECEELEEKLPAAEEACAKAQEEEKGAQDELSRLRQDQRSLATRFSKSSKECDLLRKDENKTKHRIEDREKELLRLESSKKENQKIVHAMLKKSEWLEEEQAHFNKKGGLYDFEGYSFKKGTDEVKNISDDIEKLERSLCMKNISNLDTCEARVLDIKNKRARLQEDFNMLKKTIGVLDNKKVEELNRAHKSVNKDFGTIFNCLLPDATAQLIPPEGKQVTDGLEVKVAFNGVVKDSLHELSGGQRSLVALSLILAMLKFKPAPLYILDEVDAALDLSHTANIGMMIKTHFSENQFIIVSLKQGMFSNADSLFQTSFADGHSSCRMLTGAALLKAKNDTKLAQQAQEMAESEQSAAKKAKKPASKKLARPVEDEDA